MCRYSGMPQINLGRHHGPRGSYTVPIRYRPVLTRALHILQLGMRLDATCNASFIRLDGKRSFQSWFDDPDVWINYDPSNDGKLWGWTVPSTHPKDIVITQFALMMGRWSTAATVVHELAHLNGAPGWISHAAELQVKQCHMQSKLGPYDAHIRG